MRAPDLEVPDAPAERAESTVGLVLPIRGQVPPGAQRQVDALVEVLAGLPVAADDLLSNKGLQTCPQLVLERLVLFGQLDS